MPIKFDCPWCSHTLTAPDSAAGVTAPCPKCGVQITAPADGEQPAGAGKASAVGPALDRRRREDPTAPLTSPPLPSSAPPSISMTPCRTRQGLADHTALRLVTGFLGHRFYTGHITMWIIQALTMGACALVWQTSHSSLPLPRFHRQSARRVALPRGDTVGRYRVVCDSGNPNHGLHRLKVIIWAKSGERRTSYSPVPAS